MLVLTRRVGERIRIGPDIELVILEVRGREIRVGVTAPASVTVHREELYQKITGANRAAALDTPRLAETVAQAARALRLRKDTGTPCAPSSAP
jgi:carbon storage regulator